LKITLNTETQGLNFKGEDERCTEALLLSFETQINADLRRLNAEILPLPPPKAGLLSSNQIV
jgi:hypothetical protein